MTNDPVVEARGVYKSYGSLTVLHQVSLSVTRGEVVALIGPSGSGKSTFLRCLNLLEQPERGMVSAGGVEVAFGPGQRPSASRMRDLRRHTGMVFQHFDLFPHLSVLGNVTEAPVTVRRLARSVASARAMELLEEVGLADKAASYPHQLSGGQKQRVAIARALAMEPDILLLDEVTSALDPELVGEVLGVVKKLAGTGMTMVLVTHEIAFAREVADRVGFMADGELVLTGPAAAILDRPANPRLRAFLSRYHVANATPARPDPAA